MDIPTGGYITIKQTIKKKSACHDSSKKKGKICLRSKQWMKMSLICEAALMKMPYSQKEKREKQGCHASRWEQRLFPSSLPGTREKGIHFPVGFAPFSLVYAPPADLIMSMPPGTRYNKFSLLQWHFWWKKHWADPGSGSRFLELAVAPVPPWALQIRACYSERWKWQHTQGEKAALGWC